MYKVKDESISCSKSHCKVGKITSRKNVVDGSNPIPFDFKTEAFKKATLLFTEKIKNL